MFFFYIVLNLTYSPYESPLTLMKQSFENIR